jgi:hypothetical protein
MSNRGQFAQTLEQTIGVYNRVRGLLSEARPQDVGLIRLLRRKQFLHSCRESIIKAMKEFIRGQQETALETLQNVVAELGAFESSQLSELAETSVTHVNEQLDGLVERYLDSETLEKIEQLGDRAREVRSADDLAGLIEASTKLQSRIHHASNKATLDFFGKIGVAILGIFTAIAVGVVYQTTKSVPLFSVTIAIGCVSILVSYYVIKGRGGSRFKYVALFGFLVLELLLIILGMISLATILGSYAIVVILLNAVASWLVNAGAGLIGIIFRNIDSEHNGILTSAVRGAISEEDL